ncbi:MAG: lipopolysaccharide biosynthesis protein [Flexilinea sp.]
MNIQRKAGAFLSYFQIILQNLIAIIYTPFMLRLLGQNEYGLYSLAASTVSYLGLLSFGMSSSYVKFYSRYRAEKDKNGISRLNGLYLLVFIVIGMITVGAGSILIMNIQKLFIRSLTPDEILTAKRLMILLVFNLSLTFPASIFDSYIMVHEQFFFQRLLAIAKTIFSPLLTLPLLLFGYKSFAVVAVTTILTVGGTCISIWYCKRKLKMHFEFGGFDWKLVKEIWIFSFFIFLSSIIDQVNWNISKFLLGIYKGTVSVAVYGIAAQISAYYIQFSTAISSVFIPQIYRIVSEDKDDIQLTYLFTNVGRIQFIILAFICLGFCFFGKPFIHFWAGDAYSGAYRIALLLIVPVTIPLIQNMGIEIQRAKNKHQFRSLVYLIIGGMNIGISIPLCKKYGELGCGIGTSLSFLIGNGLIMNIFYHKKIGLDIKYFWKSICSFFPALLLPTAAGILINCYIDLFQFPYFIMSCVLFSIIYFVMIWKIGMNDSEKKLFVPILRRFGIKREVV